MAIMVWNASLREKKDLIVFRTNYFLMDEYTIKAHDGVLFYLFHVLFRAK